MGQAPCCQGAGGGFPTLTNCLCLTALESSLVASLLKGYAFCKELVSPVCGYGQIPNSAPYFGTLDKALSLVVPQFSLL